jgi:hypothetical protein
MNDTNLIDKDYQMQIVMDDNAIKTDNWISPKIIHKAIDEFMLGPVGAIKGKFGWYYGKKGNNNYAKMVSAIDFENHEWFMKYVNKWVWVRREPLSKTGWSKIDLLEEIKLEKRID